MFSVLETITTGRTKSVHTHLAGIYESRDEALDFVKSQFDEDTNYGDYNLMRQGWEFKYQIVAVYFWDKEEVFELK